MTSNLSFGYRLADDRFLTVFAWNSLFFNVQVVDSEIPLDVRFPGLPEIINDVLAKDKSIRANSLARKALHHTQISYSREPFVPPSKGLKMVSADPARREELLPRDK